MNRKEYFDRPSISAGETRASDDMNLAEFVSNYLEDDQFNGAMEYLYLRLVAADFSIDKVYKSDLSIIDE